ncbi:MAG TPA: hypothetical protein VLA88_04180 [Candidatus Saccharimonadales bacterium]|nr:hypothetical protein [Candidatus Saccharimonadales bacterium]
MQQDVQNAKQLIVERIRQSTNILVAVSASPSVDALASALGLALMLNKLDKHATAVFSGTIPQAMQFLEPGKTFENSVDSLRDFIISLDKEKADRLRYKVEDDVVRIFITPYRTVISEKDLQFSQGDFNVDLILCLGVEKRDDLDKAIIAHGRILHDATVMTINANSQQSSLGLVDWHEPNSSSLSEMLVSLAEAMQQPGLLDAQIATALLTGIVAATDRFSNERTNPRVMTMSAQLMAAGANQQLIANNLSAAMQKPQTPAAGQLTEGGASVKVAAETPPPKPPKEKGELDIDHPKKGEKAKGEKNQSAQNTAKAEAELAAALPVAAVAPETFEQLKTDLEAATPPAPEPAPLPPTKKTRGPKFLEEPKKTPGSEAVNATPDDEAGPAPDHEESYLANSSWRGRRLEAPSMGGTLNATTEEAMDAARRAEEEERNHKILSHDSRSSKPKEQALAPESVPAPDPQQPQPQPEPVPVQAAEPVPAPVPEPAPVAPPPAASPEPAPLPAPEPPAPQPEPTPPAPAEPPVAPAPEPAPLPPPPTPPEPTAPEPAPAPQPEASVPTGPTLGSGDLDAARQAVTDALASQPFNPAGQPLQSAGAMPLGITNEPALAAPVEPTVPAPIPEPAPQPTPVAPEPTEPPTLSASPLPPPPPFQPAPFQQSQPAVAPAPEPSALPPLPPMPPLPQQDANGQPLPPPPLPGTGDLQPLPGNIPPAPIAPPVEIPAEPQPAAPPDPAQFQIPTDQPRQ